VTLVHLQELLDD